MLGIMLSLKITRRRENQGKRREISWPCWDLDLWATRGTKAIDTRFSGAVQLAQALPRHREQGVGVVKPRLGQRRGKATGHSSLQGPGGMLIGLWVSEEAVRILIP